MSHDRKVREAGWFYHAPAKKKELEPIPIPPTSQIPGLSDLPPEQEQQPNTKGWIKEYDSDYIKLAKQGGRADLLRFRSPKPAAAEAKGYPRVEWFYLEDNRVTDAGNDQDKEHYKPQMPEYMVHQDYEPDPRSINNWEVKYPLGKPQQRSKKTAFEHDNMSAFQRDGNRVTDKTVRLPELKKPGYGIRNDKAKAAQPNTAVAPVVRRVRGKPKEDNLIIPNTFNRMPDAELVDQTSMGKLLSYGYGRDWRQQRDDWAKGNYTPEMSAERQQQLDVVLDKGDLDRNSAGEKRLSPVLKKTEEKEKSNETKEPFKLSKFKNVPSRVNASSQSKEMSGPPMIPAQ